MPNARYLVTSDCLIALELLFRMAKNRASDDLEFTFPRLPPSPIAETSDDLRKTEIENEVVRLYDKNAAALLRHGLAICGNLEMAQDAVQEAFLRYYIARRKEMATQDTKRWLFSTARNYILDRLKEYYVRKGQSLASASHLTQDDNNPEDQIMLREIDASARELLSPRELECLRLRNEGLRYRDIADILRIDPATV